MKNTLALALLTAAAAVSAQTFPPFGVRLGEGSTTSGRSATAVGNGAHANCLDCTALGAFSRANEDSTVSVGFVGRISEDQSSDIKRRIVFVADGRDAWDAATVGQLRASEASMRAYTDASAVRLGEQIGQVDRRASAGIAAALAVAAAPTPDVPPGRLALTAGAATYDGRGALALGLATQLRGVHIRAQAAHASGGRTAIAVGAAKVF